MNIVTIYRYTDEVTKKIHISYEPMSETSCQIRYYVNADKDKMLKNIKTGKRLQAVTLPAWELNDWIEEDRIN